MADPGEGFKEASSIAGTVSTAAITIASQLGVNIAADAATAIGVGAAIGNAIPIPLLGAAIGAVIGAITAFGIWITAFARDTFHPDTATAEGWLVLMRIHPALAFLGVDTASDANDGSRLVRYFRIVSGEVPKGQKDNNGELHNPTNSHSCDNPYQCNDDEDEPLTSEAIIQDVKNRYDLWVASGGGNNLSALPRMVPTLHRDPNEAKFLLALIRSNVKVFKQIAAWSEVQANLNQIQEQLRALRILAGEDGPDPKGTLQSIFGGDLTVHQASRDATSRMSMKQLYPYSYDKSKKQWVLADQADQFYLVKATTGNLPPASWWVGVPSGSDDVKWNTASPGPGSTGVTTQYLTIWGGDMLSSPHPDFTTPSQNLLSPGSHLTVSKGPVDVKGNPIKKASGIWIPSASVDGGVEDPTLGYVAAGGALLVTAMAFVALWKKNSEDARRIPHAGR